MILAESIFFDQQPVGVIRQDSDSGRIDFSPLRGKSPLPVRSWDSVDQLKRALIKTYQKKTPVDAEAPKFLPRTTNQTKGGSVNAT